MSIVSLTSGRSTTAALLFCTGLDMAVAWLKPIKDKYSNVSWADLMQLASAASVEVIRPGPLLPAAPSQQLSTSFLPSVRSMPCVASNHCGTEVPPWCPQSLLPAEPAAGPAIVQPKHASSHGSGFPTAVRRSARYRTWAFPVKCKVVDVTFLGL